MKKNFFFIFFIFLFGCEKEEEVAFPLVQTGAVTDITPEGAVFNGRVLQKGAHEILEYGFVWGAEGTSILSDGQKISVTEAAPDGTISLFISTTLAPNVKYQVKAYVKDKDHITYGATASFVSLGSGAPSLTDFYPKAGDILDTLTITGKNFSSNKFDNRVLFDDKVSQIIYASKDTLVVQVPEFLGKEFTSLSVSVANNKAVFEEEFQLYVPEIREFYPKQANKLDTLTIVGNHLSKLDLPQRHQTKVKIDRWNLGIISVSSDTVLMIVPSYLSQETSEIQLTNHNGFSTTAEKTFKLNTPLIKNFYPEQANIKDTLTIVGKNFTLLSDPYRNTEVKIGTLSAPVLRVSPDTVIVTVPERLSEETSSLQLRNHNGISSTAEKTFRLYTPQITGFSPQEGGFDAIITVTGAFAEHPTSLEAFIGGHKAVIQESSDAWLKIALPPDLTERTNTVSVKMNHFTSVASEKFTVAPLILHDFSPKSVETGQEITITGENFHPQAYNNVVKIGELLANVIENSTTSELRVSVPLQDMDSYFPSRNVSISVEVLSDKKTFNEELFINDTWFRITDYPGTSYNNAYYKYNSFVVNNMPYIGLNGSRQLWSLDLNTNEWKELARHSAYNIPTAGFVANDRIYCGTASEWYEYNPGTNTWASKKNISDENSAVLVGFSFQNKGFVALKKSNEPYPKIWAYDDVQNSWAQAIDFPEVQGGSYYTEFALANDSELFLGLREGDDAGQSKMMMYVYSFATASWRKIANYPADGGTTSPLKFILNNQLYLKTHFASNFWKYDGGTNSWIQEPAAYLPSNMEGGISFSAWEKAYIGLGEKKAIWEYDPNR